MAASSDSDSETESVTPFGNRPLYQRVLIVFGSIALSPLLLVYLAPRIGRGILRHAVRPTLAHWRAVAKPAAVSAPAPAAGHARPLDPQTVVQTPEVDTDAEVQSFLSRPMWQRVLIVGFSVLLLPAILWQCRAAIFRFMAATVVRVGRLVLRAATAVGSWASGRMRSAARKTVALVRRVGTTMDFVRQRIVAYVLIPYVAKPVRTVAVAARLGVAHSVAFVRRGATAAMDRIDVLLRIAAVLEDSMMYVFEGGAHRLGRMFSAGGGRLSPLLRSCVRAMKRMLAVARMRIKSLLRWCERVAITALRRMVAALRRLARRTWACLQTCWFTLRGRILVPAYTLTVRCNSTVARCVRHASERTFDFAGRCAAATGDAVNSCLNAAATIEDRVVSHCAALVVPVIRRAMRVVCTTRNATREGLVRCRRKLILWARAFTRCLETAVALPCRTFAAAVQAAARRSGMILSRFLYTVAVRPVLTMIGTVCRVVSSVVLQLYRRVMEGVAAVKHALHVMAQWFYVAVVVRIGRWTKQSVLITLFAARTLGNAMKLMVRRAVAPLLSALKLCVASLKGALTTALNGVRGALRTIQLSIREWLRAIADFLSAVRQKLGL